ncbi:MAG: hypothetical protein ACRC5A_12365 [Enterobacteriaceae bacterium]
MNTAQMNGVVLNGDRGIYASCGSSGIEFASQAAADIWIPSGEGHSEVVVTGALTEHISHGVSPALSSEFSLKGTLSAFKRITPESSVLIEIHCGFFAGLYVTLEGDTGFHFSSSLWSYKFSRPSGMGKTEFHSAMAGNLFHSTRFKTGDITFAQSLELQRGTPVQGRAALIWLNGRCRIERAGTHRPRLRSDIGFTPGCTAYLVHYGIEGKTTFSLDSSGQLCTSTRMPLAGLATLNITPRSQLRILHLHRISGQSELKFCAFTAPGIPTLPGDFYAAPACRVLMVSPEPRTVNISKEHRP